jgi:hypothetical protein
MSAPPSGALATLAPLACVVDGVTSFSAVEGIWGL